ncbi:MAG: type 1 glutamine amidotransferase domain-containing protein [Elusimicrobia bacterium]|nr:type 1 glutamine amidotransferase domain-containing protein [Elusimicrobiota bacterium]
MKRFALCLWVIWVMNMGSHVVQAKIGPKKVLIVVTSHDVLGKTGRATGFWLSELAYPYEQLQQAGFQVEIASPQGGRPPLEPSRLDAVSQKFMDVPKEVAKLNQTIPLSAIQRESYRGVLFVGGNGAMFDFFHNDDATRIAQVVWDNGGVVAALGEGAIALLDVRSSNGRFLLEGKKVTCFSQAEQKDTQERAGEQDIGWTVLEWELQKRGAIVENFYMWEPNVIVNGRLLTGQNPASAPRLAKEFVALLQRQR